VLLVNSNWQRWDNGSNKIGIVSGNNNKNKNYKPKLVYNTFYMLKCIHHIILFIVWTCTRVEKNNQIDK